MKKVIVACGTGIATSTLVVQKLKDLVASKNLAINIQQGTYSEVEGYIDSDTVLIISSSNIGKEVKGVPVLIAIPYISGINVEMFEDKIIDIITR